MAEYTMQDCKYKAGDWVCFHRGGPIVYAKVEYVGTQLWNSRAFVLHTTLGEVNAEYVLEVRHG